MGFSRQGELFILIGWEIQGRERKMDGARSWRREGGRGALDAERRCRVQASMRWEREAVSFHYLRFSKISLIVNYLKIIYSIHIFFFSRWSFHVDCIQLRWKGGEKRVRLWTG